MTSPRPTRRSLDSTLSRLSQVSSSTPSSSQSTSYSSPFSPSSSSYKRRDSLDSVYSSSSSFCSYGTATSPPTRWPTSRTPRRRRPLDSLNQSILDSSTVSSFDESLADESTVSSLSMDSLNDSGFHDDIFRSPPVNKATLNPTSLLRTPTNDLLRQRSTNSAFFASVNSPSPLRSFKIREVSHISSNVSRTGQSTLMRFSGADASDSHLVHIGKAEPTLQFNRHQRPYSPSPSTMRQIKVATPSKGYEGDDSLFSMTSSSMMHLRDIPEITSGPIESSLFPYGDPSYFAPLGSSMNEEEDTCDGFEDDSDDDDDDDDEEEEEEMDYHSSPLLRPSILQQPPSAATTAPSFSAPSVRQPLGDLQQNSLKRRAEDGWKGGLEAKKANYGIRANLDRPVTQIIAEDVKPDLTLLNASMAATPAANAAKPKSSFRTPKKPFKTYSKRWWQVCTGATQEVRTLTSQAHAFLRRFSLDSTPSMSFSSTMMTMGGMKEDFDSDIHFAPYLTGLDTTYTAPEDPLNYQPPPLTLLY